jgi:hypothetical protein
MKPRINLPDNISSRQDLREVILEVRRYAKWYSQTAVKMQFSGKNAYEQPEFSPAANNVISEWNKTNPISSKSLDELIAELEDLAAKALHITITLGAPPPGSLKKALVKWCRANIAPVILVDFKFNSTILGGMVVQFKSHVYDWSIRRQLLAGREKFPETLRNV